MSKRNRRLAGDLAKFTKQCGRKKRKNGDPNDRGYDKTLQRTIRRMDPSELDELLDGGGEDDYEYEG